MKRQPILFSTGRFIDLNCMKRILSLWGIYDMHKRACFQSTAFGDRPAYVDTSVPFQERKKYNVWLFIKTVAKRCMSLHHIEEITFRCCIHPQIDFADSATHTWMNRQWKKARLARLKNGNRDHHLCLPAVVDLSCRMTVGKQALKIVIVI